MNKYRQDQYQKVREREKELRAQGYKGSAVWNKLHFEFPQWMPHTILDICRKHGIYKNK